MKQYRSIPIILHETFLSSDELSNEIQLLRVGTFFHEGQQITVGKKELKQMVHNFKENTRGIDLMLDYSHNSESEAAAWFTDIFLSEDGKELWDKVDWTNDGADAVRSKKFRYISADFSFAYKDNETLREFGPTLFGAGLTNRPVIKNMEATIELSETNNQSKDNEMNELEEMKKKFADLEKKHKDGEEKIKELTEKLSADAKLSETEAQEKREVELNEREEKINLAEKKTEEDKKLAEKKGAFDKMLAEGKTVEAQRESYMSDDFAKFAENAGTVNLSEAGTGTAGTGETKETNFSKSETPAQDEVISLAEKKMEENKDLDEDAAYNLVLSENSELNKKYEIEVNG